MKKFVAVLLILTVFICGCINQETTSPTPTQSSATTSSLQASFAIKVSGLTTGEITPEELQSLGGVEFNATLVKSTGAKINNTYVGVPLKKVFEKLGIDESKVKWVRFRAEDGYEITLSMDDLKNAYLCWEENGEPLGPDNGGPIKLVIPDQPGKLWLKWLSEIKLIGDENAVVIHGKTKVTVVVTREDIDELMKSFGMEVTVELRGENVTFSGVPLKLFLDKARPDDDAVNITFIAKDGYSATLDFMAVYENDKAILTPDFRVVIPGEPSRTWVKDLKEIVIG
ncbi:reductase 1 [Thermococcus onnurineus NA1]|uniref:Reductase 1 n=1 Tax=Thermococcus onnurineus (strain NA1) TaxID=523850 RepID=B6YT99_THEON|nr:molybdopterin-dependent oxidoreductase [Thermococcus onnurineus]ACJ15786.1 reductase 1 [Thermococcus onnurineus NA1]